MVRLVFSLFVILSVIAGLCHGHKQRLIVVLLDGVRWDYVYREPNLKGFARIAKEGVRVKYVTPIFPSVSYPNWYTIVTGLYAESHGMVDNYMYDQKRNDKFLMSPHPNVTHEHWWNKTEPIWVNAEKNGKRVAMHYWDGCQVPIHGVKPMQCEPYRQFWNWTGSRADTLAKMSDVLEWFEEQETHQLALVYYEGPDAYGHRYGPDSDETKMEMRETDRMLDAFQDKLEASKIKDQINLVIVSDHGMTDVESSKKIRLEKFDGTKNIKLTLNGGAEGSILPVDGKDKKVYEDLTDHTADGLHVYRKKDIPTEYHLANGELTLPIMVVADLGYVILMPNRTSDAVSKGIHGYDPYKAEKDGTNQMRTIMFARGPAFRRGVVGEPIQQTDHYNIFCYILNLKPHANNGSWERVKDLLIIKANDATCYHQACLSVMTLGVVALATFILGRNE